MWKFLVLILAVTALTSSPVPGQELWVGPSVGAGQGPAASISTGLGLLVQLQGPFRLRVEGGRTIQGLTACEQVWPESYECDARPVELLVGTGLGRKLGRRSSAYLDAFGGIHRVDPEFGGTAPAVRLAAGTQVLLGGAWLGSLDAYWQRALNDEYETLMGQKPQYLMIAVAVRYRIR